MPLQIIAFPPELRKHLADLHLQRETEQLSAADYDTECAEVIAAVGVAMGVDPDYQTGQTPPEVDHPTGRQGCWWKQVGLDVTTGPLIAASKKRVATMKKG